MSLTNITTYTDAGDFTFDSALVEISGSKAQLVDTIPTNATFGANYTADENGIWGDGTLTATLNGNASVSGGELDLIYVDTDTTNVEIVATSKINASKGSIDFVYIPNYTGAPANDQKIIQFDDTDGSFNNLFQFFHTTANNWVIAAYTSAGSVSMNNVTFGSLSLTSGQRYDISINWDFTPSSEAHRVFIDGTQSGSTDTTASSRSNDITTVTFLRVGGHEAGRRSNFKIDDLTIYKEVAHTANHAPSDYTVVDQYSKANPTILTNSATGATGLLSISNVVTTAGSDAVKWTIFYGGVDHYLSGGVLVVSDGTYAQSNTAAELEAAMPLDIDPDGSIQMKGHLHSDDGTTTPDITSVTFEYNFFSSMVSLGQCVVWGYVYDNTTAVEGAKISFKANSVQDVGGNWVEIDTEVKSNSAGYFSATLAETATSSTKVKAEISFTNSNNKAVSRKFDIIVPNQSSSPLDDAKDLAL